MENVFNKEELIGQKIHCQADNGHIIKIDSGHDYPVLVAIENSDRRISFTVDGKLILKDRIPSLKFGHVNTDAKFNYGKPNLPWFADWDDPEQVKYYITFNTKELTASAEYTAVNKTIGVSYMSLEEAETLVKQLKTLSKEELKEFI